METHVLIIASARDLFMSSMTPAKDTPMIKKDRFSSCAE